MLVWWCKNCEAKEVVESTGDPDNEYELGDSDPCIDCGSLCKVVEEKDAVLCGECDGREEIECFNCGGDGVETFFDEDDNEDEETCVECAGEGMLPCDACQ